MRHASAVSHVLSLRMGMDHTHACTTVHIHVPAMRQALCIVHCAVALQRVSRPGANCRTGRPDIRSAHSHHAAPGSRFMCSMMGAGRQWCWRRRTAHCLLRGLSKLLPLKLSRLMAPPSAELFGVTGGMFVAEARRLTCLTSSLLRRLGVKRMGNAGGSLETALWTVRSLFATLRSVSTRVH